MRKTTLQFKTTGGNPRFSKEVFFRRKLREALEDSESDNEMGAFVKESGNLGEFLLGKEPPFYRLDIRWRLYMARKKFEEYEKKLRFYKKTKLQRIVESLRFDCVFGFLIVVNALTIGASVNYRDPKKRPQILQNAEQFFTSIFVVEFFLRVRSFTPQKRTI